MVDNKVVIRINYDKDKYRKKTIDPKMVTVWHKGRIFFATLLMSSLIVLLAVLLRSYSGEESKASSSLSGIESVADETLKTEDMLPEKEKEKEKEKVNAETASGQSLSSSQDIIMSKPDGIILNKRVIRASVNQSVDNSGKEAYVIVDSMVHLDQNNKLQTFNYFSEVKGVRESSLFHRWFKNGQLVHSKQFTIKDRKSKLLSSRKFGFKDLGQWEILLIDKHGKVWSRSTFEVSQH